MRHFLLLCVLLLAACGPGPDAIANPSLFDPCDGWTGEVPATEREIILAAEAEIACGNRMRAQLSALAESYGVAQ